MCGRFALHADQQMLAIHFDSEPLPESIAPQPRFNIAPSTWNPVILAAPPVGVIGEAPRHIRLMKWGLHPSWGGHKPRFRPINARVESILEKRMFAPLTSRRRCIIPANGWFEWVKDGGERIPFYHYHRDGEPLALAGLWTSWSGGEGDLIESFTIITSPASPQFSSVHHRMPALLGREDWQMWLDTSLSAEIAIQCVDRERVDAVSLEIDHHEVSQQVNNVANQSEDLLTAVTHH